MPSPLHAPWVLVCAGLVGVSSACKREPTDGGASATESPSPTSPAPSSATDAAPTASTATSEPSMPTSAAPTTADDPAAPVVDEMTRAQMGIAEVEGLALKNAATIFLAQRGKCAPDVAALVQGGFIANASPDPWGGEYRLECGADGETMKVHSNGPDGRRDTPDDVHVE